MSTLNNSRRKWTFVSLGEDEHLDERVGSHPYLFDQTSKTQGKGCSWKSMEKVAEELDFIEDVTHSGFSCV